MPSLESLLAMCQTLDRDVVGSPVQPPLTYQVEPRRKTLLRARRELSTRTKILVIVEGKCYCNEGYHHMQVIIEVHHGVHLVI